MPLQTPPAEGSADGTHTRSETRVQVLTKSNTWGPLPTAVLSRRASCVRDRRPDPATKIIRLLTERLSQSGARFVSSALSAHAQGADNKTETGQLVVVVVESSSLCRRRRCCRCRRGGGGAGAFVRRRPSSPPPAAAVVLWCVIPAARRAARYGRSDEGCSRWGGPRRSARGWAAVHQASEQVPCAWWRVAPELGPDREQ